MAAFIQPALEATTAFSATNIDDLFILMLFFSRLDHSLRAWHVVCGQFLGIAALVGLSLLSLLGRGALPEGVIGLLGLFPISLGLTQLAETLAGQNGDAGAEDDPGSRSAEGWLASIIAVSTLTIANGGDNISVYMAMLANSDPLRLIVFPVMFVFLTGLWCLLAWWLSQASLLARPLRRFQRDLAPVLLVGLGALVLQDSHTLRHPPLAIVALACVGLMVGSLILQLRLLLRDRPLAGVPRP